MKAERRRGELWAPKGKSLPLPGPFGPLGSGPLLPSLYERSAQRALGPHACLTKHIKQFDRSNPKPPTEEKLRNALVHASPTAPGPDGLPYSAWRGAKIA
eukprot:7350865-Pyramimonas_sp.AAC.1